MMRKPPQILAILFPLIGLAGIWGWSDYQSRQGTDWEVPIEGYDPRDLLRGHYVEFNYDWPGLEGGALMGATRLCIHGAAPVIEKVTVFADGQDCTHPIESDHSGVYGMSALATGRLYVGQDRARELQTKLWDRKQSGFVIVRQREDGHMTPQDIIFRPAPGDEAMPDGNAPAPPLIDVFETDNSE